MDEGAVGVRPPYEPALHAQAAPAHPHDLDAAEDLLPPDVLAADIVENLRDALSQFEAVADALDEVEVS